MKEKSFIEENLAGMTIAFIIIILALLIALNYHEEDASCLEKYAQAYCYNHQLVYSSDMPSNGADFTCISYNSLETMRVKGVDSTKEYFFYLKNETDSCTKPSQMEKWTK